MSAGLSVEQLDAIERHAEIMSEADGAHARAGVFSSDDVLALVGMARDAIRLREEIEKMRLSLPEFVFYKTGPAVDEPRVCAGELPCEGVGRRLQHNPGPLESKPIPTCTGCGKRAPWCSCGAANYVLRESQS